MMRTILILFFGIVSTVNLFSQVSENDYTWVNGKIFMQAKADGYSLGVDTDETWSHRVAKEGEISVRTGFNAQNPNEYCIDTDGSTVEVKLVKGGSYNKATIYSGSCPCSCGYKDFLFTIPADIEVGNDYQIYFIYDFRPNNQDEHVYSLAKSPYFTIGTTPQFTFPASANETISKNASVTWNNIPEANQYSISIYRTSDLTTPVHDVSFHTQDEFDLSSANLEGGVEYKFVLKSNQYSKEFSNSITFTTAIEPILDVAPIEKNISSSSGSFTLNIESNIDWTLHENSDWFYASQTNGNGNSTVTIYYEENNNTSSRTEGITLTGMGVDDLTVTVLQEKAGEFLIATPSPQLVTATSGNFTFNIESNTDWTISENYDWLSVSSTGGSGNETITVTYDKNTTTTTRKAIITINGTNVSSKTIEVTQEEADLMLNVSFSSKNILSKSGNFTVDVYSNTDWTVAENSDWISINKVSGSGNSSVIVSFIDNTKISTRSATITFTATGVEDQTLKVIQDGASSYLSASPVQKTITASSGSFQIEIDSNTEWTATANTDWLSISPTSKNGGGIVTVTYEANPAPTVRGGEITITASGVSSKVVEVKQEGAAKYLTVTPTAQSVSASEGNFAVNIESNTNWNISENSSWFYISSTGGSGSKNVTVYYLENKKTNSRTGTLTFSSDGITKTVSITQQSADILFSITPTSRNLTSVSGNFSIDITSNSSWNLTENSNWFYASRTSGSGNHTVTIYFEQNKNTSSRTETLIFNCGDITKTVDVTQQGTDVSLSISSTYQNLTSSSGNFSVDVICNSSWSLAESSDWFHVSPNDGTGNTPITVYYSENKNSTPRTNDIVFTSGQLRETLKVSQEGAIIEPNSEPSIKIGNMFVNQEFGSNKIKIIIKIDDDENDEITTLEAYFDKVGNQYSNNICVNVLQLLGKANIPSNTEVEFEINIESPKFLSVFDKSGQYEVKFNCIDTYGGKANVGASGSNNTNNCVFKYNIVYDNGFRPKPNGWKFSNTKMSNVSWDAYVMAFGEDHCYEDNTSGRVKNSSAYNAFKYMYRNVRSLAGGSCFGFATSSFMAYDNPLGFKMDYPNLNFSKELYNLDLTEDAKTCINSLWIRQIEESYGLFFLEKYSNSKNKTKDILVVLRQQMKKKDHHVMYLSREMYKIHVVTPYKIVTDPRDENIEYIYVYDNNYPNDTALRVKIDKAENKWYYNDPEDGKYSLSGYDQGLFVLNLPVSQFRHHNYYKKKKSETENQTALRLFNSPFTSISIQGEDGKKYGFDNETLILEYDKNDVFPIICAMDTFYPPIGYHLMNKKYAINLNSRDSSKNYLYLIGDSISFIYEQINKSAEMNDELLINNDSLTVKNNEDSVKEYNLNISTKNKKKSINYIFNANQLKQKGAITFAPKEQKLIVRGNNTRNLYNLTIQIIEGDTVSISSGKQTVLKNETQEIQPLIHTKDTIVEIKRDYDSDGIIDEINLISSLSANTRRFNIPLVKTYPNPVTESLNILFSTSRNNKKTTVCLYDMFGKEVLREEYKVVLEITTISLDLSNFKQGLYLLKIEQNDRIITEKVMVQ